MFFVFGIGQQQKVLSFDQTVICPVCGRFGHMTVVMVYSYFSLFFIPLFKWNKRYMVQLGCCGASANLDAELGRRIAQGEDVSLDPESLGFTGGGQRRCRSCGYEAGTDFAYCPKCGTKF